MSVHRADGGRELDVPALLRASRRRRLYGAVGGGMVGSGLAAVAVAAINAWASRPSSIVWIGLLLGLPLAVLGVVLINRIGD